MTNFEKRQLIETKTQTLLLANMSNNLTILLQFEYDLEMKSPNKIMLDRKKQIENLAKELDNKTKAEEIK